MPDEPIPSPLQAQANQWMPILAQHWPNHTLTAIFHELHPDEPDKVVLRIELTPTTALPSLPPPTDPDPNPQP